MRGQFVLWFWREAGGLAEEGGRGIEGPSEGAGWGRGQRTGRSGQREGGERHWGVFGRVECDPPGGQPDGAAQGTRQVGHTSSERAVPSGDWARECTSWRRPQGERRQVSARARVRVSFPGGADGKASARNAGRPGFSPWLGKMPWRRKWQPAQYSCLENPMDGGA